MNNLNLHDDGFRDYVATSVEPGDWLFFTVLIYSLLCILIIPIIVTISRFHIRVAEDDEDKEEPIGLFEDGSSPTDIPSTGEEIACSTEKSQNKIDECYNVESKNRSLIDLANGEIIQQSKRIGNLVVENNTSHSSMNERIRSGAIIDLSKGQEVFTGKECIERTITGKIIDFSRDEHISETDEIDIDILEKDNSDARMEEKTHSDNFIDLSNGFKYSASNESSSPEVIVANSNEAKLYEDDLSAGQNISNLEKMRIQKIYGESTRKDKRGQSERNLSDNLVIDLSDGRTHLNAYEDIATKATAAASSNHTFADLENQSLEEMSKDSVISLITYGEVSIKNDYTHSSLELEEIHTIKESLSVNSKQSQTNYTSETNKTTEEIHTIKESLSEDSKQSQTTSTEKTNKIMIVKPTKKKSDFCEKTFSIIRYDKETNRILILGIPFMVSAVAVALFDAITLALVSKYLGVEALSAYVVTNVLLGLTDTFIKGVADALNTVCSHAIGADNYFLAGQYTQIALMIYVIGSVPLCVCWWFLMDDVIRLFGMNERVVEIGAQYTKLVMFDYMAVGMFDTFTALLDVSGYALPATIMDLAAASLDLLSVWLLLMFVEGMDLFWVGMAQMVSSVVIYGVFVCFVVYKGWIDPFKSGLVHSFGLKNIPAVKYVLKTAIPLSIGTLLEYGEWEALTFFAAVLGPAEVATWGILEAIWDLFEAFTEGLGEAGSIRLAFHLGKGNIDMAKLSAWKLLFISMCLALTVSALLFVLMPYIPGMFTDDETLQDMVHDVLPLIGIGNIFMVFGMVSWSLIGAQGRFKLATMVSAVMTFAVTLPLSAVSSIVYHFTLEGLVGAVVVGYSTTGLVLGCILQLSPWDRISKKIQDLNAAENEDVAQEKTETFDEDLLLSCEA